MKEYNLEPGEFVVMQEKSPRLYSGSSYALLDEVVLTNRNLILVKTQARGIFDMQRMLKRCPLEETLDSQGYPQVATTKIDGKHILQAMFGTENIALGFANESKETANRWAEGIRRASVGDLSGISTENSSGTASGSDELDDLINAGKSIVGAFMGIAAPAQSKPQQKKQASNKQHQGNAPLKAAPRASVARKCRGCHAPLTGRKGDTVTCVYCDTKQTL